MTEVAQLKSDNESSHLLPSNPATPLPKAFPVCCLPAHARAARPSSVAAVDTRARQTTPKNKKKTKAGRRECASPSLFTSRGVQGAGHTLSTSRLGLCSSSPPPPALAESTRPPWLPPRIKFLDLRQLLVPFLRVLPFLFFAFYPAARRKPERFRGCESGCT